MMELTKFSNSDTALYNEECSRYKKGTFYYHLKISDSDYSYTIYRNDSTQIEQTDKTGYRARYRMRWLTNCSYELRLIDQTEPITKELLEIKMKMVIKTTILQGNSSYYLFRSTSSLSTNILTDTIWLRK
jgi:hypothetical protein